ncbi:MAG: sigma-70 family RNA polymerase sigma factor [Erythrobacter sp.]|nr:sigma-70 family RNA polymerase sigma factor [Erythrobacter sp.]
MDVLDDLMAAARTGDAAAYRQFLAEVAVRVRSRLASKIGADSELEDLVQEVLIAVHQKRHTHDPSRPVAPWLNAIAGYKLIDHWRRRGRSPIELDDSADMAVAADSMAGLDVDSLLDQLPDHQAEAIRLTHIDGLTSSEAGEQLGVGTSAMKLRVHRGLNRLKALIAEDEA